jgi:hypothetical protein
MLARDEKDLPEPVPREVLSFGDDLINVERDAKDRVIPRKTAIPTIIDAFIGKIQRREQAHRASEILQR